MRTLNLGLAVVLISACTVGSVDFAGKSCSEDAECPGELVCAAGICARPGEAPDAGLEPDASVTSATPTIEELRQHALVGGELLEPGASIKEPPILKAVIGHPEQGEVRMEVEVVEAAAEFTGATNHVGAFTAGGLAEIVLDGLEAGTYRWQARAVDREGNGSELIAFHEGAVAFTLLPRVIDGSLTIEDGRPFVRARAVTLGLEAVSRSGAAIAEVEFSNDGVSWSDPEPFATSRPGWELTAEDGPKRVFARVTDEAGESQVFTATVGLDTTPPEVRGTVGNGSGFTRSSTVPVTLDASDATSGLATIAFSDDGIAFEEPSAFFSSWDWELLEGDGEKVVHVRVADVAGNFTDLRLAVVFDTVPPQPSLTIEGGAAWTNSVEVELEVDVSDLSGLATMALSNDGTSFGAPVPYAASHRHTLAPGDGDKKVWIRLTDLAGNVGEASAAIALDTVPPLITEFELARGNPWTFSRQVEVRWTATDDGAGVDRAEVVDLVEPENPTIESVSSSPSMVRLNSIQGVREVELRVFDAAGNQATLSRTLAYDGTGPTTPSQVALEPRSGGALLHFSPSTDALSGIDRYEARVYRSGTTPGPWVALAGLTPPFRLTGMKNGASHLVSVRAVDKAGNVSAATSNRSVTPAISFEFRHAFPVEWHGVVHVSSSDLVMVGEKGVILRSRSHFDGGATAPTRRDSGVGTTLRAVARQGSAALAVGDGGAVVASMDGGDAWYSMVKPGIAPDLYAVAALPAGGSSFPFIAVGDRGTVRVGTLSDNPPKWNAHTVTPPTTEALRAVSLGGASSSRLIVAGDNGALFYTSNGGSTWLAGRLPFTHQRMNIRALVTVGGVLNPEYFAVGEPPASGRSPVLQSDDGINWVEWSRNALSGLSALGASAAWPMGSSGFFAGAEYQYGIERSVPKIIYAASSSSLTNVSPASGFGKVHAISVSGERTTAVGEAGEVYVSTQRGSDFERLAVGRQVRLVDVWTSSSGGNVWLIGEEGYFAFSQDGGANWDWQVHSSAKTSRAIASNDFLENGREAIVVGANGQLGLMDKVGYRSVLSPTNVDLNDVFCGRSGGCFAVGAQATVLGTSDGRSWNRIHSEGSSAPELMGVASWTGAGGITHVAAVGANGAVRYMQRSGFLGTFATKEKLVAIDASRDAKGYALALGASGQVYLTSDGSLWKQVGNLGTGVKGTDIAFSHGNIWFATTEAHGAFTSSDAGETWKKVPTHFELPFSFVHSRGKDSLWIGGDRGALLFSPFTVEL